MEQDTGDKNKSQGREEKAPVQEPRELSVKMLSIFKHSPTLCPKERQSQ